MLTEAHAAVIKGLRDRGEKQQDIAAFFGENSGRIADICTGRKYAHVRPAPAHLLPTPDQIVPWGFILSEARKGIALIEAALLSARAKFDDIEATLKTAAELTMRRPVRRQPQRLEPVQHRRAVRTRKGWRVRPDEHTGGPA